MSGTPLIVGVGGTTRAGSTSERALLTALAHAQALGCDTLAFGGAQLPRDIYDTANPARSADALGLVEALRRADGVIIATPAYHGGVSGLVKNAIDYTEDLRTDPRVYLQGRAVGCIVVADGPQALGATLASLRAIVHALRGWPTPFGAAINATTQPFGGPDGRGPDPSAVAACHTVAAEVVQFARMARAAAAQQGATATGEARA